MYVFFGFCAAGAIAQADGSNSLAWATLAFAAGCIAQTFAKD